MSWHLWAGYLFVFFFGTMLSLVVEGAYYSASDVTFAEQLLGFNVTQLQGAGILTIPKIGASLITNALPKIVMWDYAFFEGSWSLFRLGLITIFGAPMVVAVAGALIPVVQGVFQRFFGGMVS